jgi:hypothetical protein
MSKQTIVPNEQTNRLKNSPWAKKHRGESPQPVEIKPHRSVTERSSNERRSNGDAITDTVQPSNDDKYAAVAGVDAQVITRRDSYEADIRHLDVFKALFRLNRSFNKSEYVRKALERQMGEDGLL